MHCQNSYVQKRYDLNHLLSKKDIHDLASFIMPHLYFHTVQGKFSHFVFPLRYQKQSKSYNIRGNLHIWDSDYDIFSVIIVSFYDLNPMISTQTRLLQTDRSDNNHDLSLSENKGSVMSQH